MLNSEPDVEICSETLEVLTADPGLTQVIVEEHKPSEVLRERDRMWSCHSSGDSGIYSTEEGSGLRQSKCEEVKMEKIVGMNEGEELDERMQIVSI